MNNEFITQYAHLWRVFERMVNDFNADSWLHTGRLAITPARLSLHILQSMRYYLQDTSEVVFKSGKRFDTHWIKAAEEELPSQEDIVLCAHDYRCKTEDWLAAMELSAPNTAFGWAGKTQLGVAIFTLKHMTFHLGELASLLNESKNGVAPDHFAAAIDAKD